ncbi:MAG: acyltransferase family protein [Hyphomicrobiales bacterium]|nr:acyltransferase family protein [Hyphomicrobiales bacterium]
MGSALSTCTDSPSDLRDPRAAESLRASGPAPQPYHAYIDGLRAVAILSVFLFHIEPKWLPGGFGGVDVFFVISGFVVSSSLRAHTGDSYARFMGDFLARRARRILPPFVVVIVATYLFAAAFIPKAYLSNQIAETGWAALLAYANVYLSQNVDAYFAPRAEYNPFTHAWSLSVEEQFYFLFPTLFFLITSRRRRWAHAVFLLLCAASIWFAFAPDGVRRSDAFYWIAGRFWELGAGVLMMFHLEAQRRHASGPRRERAAFAYAGCTLVAAGFVMNAPHLYPLPGAMLPVAGALLVIYGLHDSDGRSLATRFLSAAPMTAVGKLSYSLYLWHWPLIIGAKWTAGIEGAPVKIAIGALTIVLSWLSYRLVERPFRFAALHRRLWVSLAASVALLVGALGALRTIDIWEPKLAQTAAKRFERVWYPNLVDLPGPAGCTLSVIRRGAGAGFESVMTRQGCAPQATRRLFVIGDSHATAYITMLASFTMATGVDVHLFDNAGCSFASFVPVSAACTQTSAASLQAVDSTITAGDLVFLPSLRLFRLRNQESAALADVDVMMNSVAAFRLNAIEAYRGDLRPLVQKGARIVFELPKPIFPTPLFRCIDWFNRMNPVCAEKGEQSRAVLLAYRQPVVDAILSLSTTGGMTVWDPFPVLCPNEPCAMGSRRAPLFFDGDHLSHHGNLMLAPSFIAFMRELMEQEPAGPKF